MMDNHSTKTMSGRRTTKRGQRLPRRPVFPGLPPSLHAEETLVVDDRAHLRPAQIVENKLTKLLQEATVPVSHLQMRGLVKAR
jgi:hypothetical protein